MNPITRALIAPLCLIALTSQAQAAPVITSAHSVTDAGGTGKNTATAVTLTGGDVHGTNQPTHSPTTLGNLDTQLGTGGAIATFAGGKGDNSGSAFYETTTGGAAGDKFNFFLDNLITGTSGEYFASFSGGGLTTEVIDLGPATAFGTNTAESITLPGTPAGAYTVGFGEVFTTGNGYAAAFTGITPLNGSPAAPEVNPSSAVLPLALSLGMLLLAHDRRHRQRNA